MYHTLKVENLTSVNNSISKSVHDKDILNDSKVKRGSESIFTKKLEQTKPIQYRNDEIDGTHFVMEEASNAYSTLGGLYGAAWGIGWEAGRWLTFRDSYQQWKQETVLPWRMKYFGY